MNNAYAGPLRDEPLAIELHNTLYAVSGRPVDGLADAIQARAWLDAVTSRLPAVDLPRGPQPATGDLVALRGAVRTALHAAVEQRPLDPTVLTAINEASRRAPRSPQASQQIDGHVQCATCFHGASRADIIIGAFAQDAIALLTSPLSDKLRTCGAPGCVLMFLKDHPRREWCSQGCGNRARQARHYRRTHPRTAQ